MTAKLTCRYTGRKDFEVLSESGPRTVPDRVLRRMAGSVLDAIPRTKSKYLIKGEVWVDAENFGVSRVVIRPAKNPSFCICDSRFVCRHTKFGIFWPPVARDSEAEVLVFGHTEVKIRNQDYHINSDQGAASGVK